jgi:hypothetical protein
LFITLVTFGGPRDGIFERVVEKVTVVIGDGAGPGERRLVLEWGVCFFVGCLVKENLCVFFGVSRMNAVNDDGFEIPACKAPGPWRVAFGVLKCITSECEAVGFSCAAGFDAQQVIK